MSDKMDLDLGRYAGLFVQDESGSLVFKTLPPPTDQDIEHLTERLARRLGAIAKRRMDEARDESPPDDEDAFVHESAQASLRVPPTELHLGPTQWGEGKPLCAKKDGFSLHAARTGDAHDRAGLERLCRYGLCSPFSKDRLSIDPDGRVRYRLYRPWTNPAGRTSIVKDPDVTRKILDHLKLPSTPPAIAPARCMEPDGGMFNQSGDLENTGIRELPRPFPDAGLRIARAPP